MSTPSSALEAWLEEFKSAHSYCDDKWCNAKITIAVIEVLKKTSEIVIYQAIEAELSMSKNKVISMEMSDLKRLRLLGAAIDELQQALAINPEKL